MGAQMTEEEKAAISALVYVPAGSDDKPLLHKLTHIAEHIYPVTDDILVIVVSRQRVSWVARAAFVGVIGLGSLAAAVKGVIDLIAGG